MPLSKRMLGKEFSKGSMNKNPVVSFDGNTIAYTEKRGLVNAIYFSKKIKGRWQTPVEITAQLNAGDDCSTCSLNKDGTELFLYKNDGFDGNIYSSKYVNELWTPRLNKNINTKYYESHASVSADGKSYISQVTGKEEKEVLIFMYRKLMQQETGVFPSTWVQR